MKREEFIKNVALLGLSAPFMNWILTSCEKDDIFKQDFEVNFSGKVLIVGSGAAGLIAGHLLKQYGIDFEIIEANPVYGGRIKGLYNFADFPIDLGAEWIHTDPSILSKLINDDSVNVDMDIIKYRPETIYLYDDGKLKKRNMYSNFYGENKFKNSGWFDFFDQYIYPSVSDKITLNSPVNQIDYSGDQVIVTNENGDEFTGDRVIVTVPIKILQNQSINFIPAFDSGRQEAIDKVDMPDGLKVLIEFSEKFYPDILNMGSLVDFSDDSSGERIYYNAAFRKDTIHHVFALFSVGEASSQYTSLGSDDAIIEKVMAELDEIFDGKATQTYIQHRVQNWSAEPYIQGSYSHYGNDYSSIIETISSSINGKIFFAGEAMTSENWSTVHGAGETSFAVVEEILKNA